MGLLWRTVLLASCTAFLAGGGAAQAPSGNAGAAAHPRVMLFNIPAQALGPALVAYSNVVGNQVIYDARLAARRRSAAVIGLFTPETALRMLLEGTDLTIRYTSPNDVTLVALSDVRRPGAASEAEAPGEASLTLDTLYVDLPPGSERRPDFSDYGRVVRSEIRQALARSSEVSHRILTVQIEISIDGEGRFFNPRLTRSTGDHDLDAAVQRTLVQIRTRQPPPQGMPQPIRVTILGI